MKLISLKSKKTPSPSLLKIGICILTVIAVEIMRKKGNKSKSIIFAEGISVLILIAYLIIFILNLIK